MAVMVAAPPTTPVTRPLLLTAATAGALLVHVTTRPANAAPLESVGVATSCSDCPTPTLAVVGLTTTAATCFNSPSSCSRVHPTAVLMPARSTTFLSRARPRDNLCLNVIASLPSEWILSDKHQQPSWSGGGKRARTVVGTEPSH